MISIITRIQIEGNDTVSFQNGTNYVQSMSQIMPQIPTYISYGYDSITITQGVAKPFQFSIYQITQVGGNSFTALNFQDSADVVQQRTIDVYTLLVTVVFKGCCECGSTEPECAIQYTYGNSGLTGEFDYTYGTPGLIRFNDITGNNQDFSGFFPLIPDGSWVFLFSKTDPTVYAVLQLSNYINAGGAAAFDAIELNANGTPFVEGTQFCVDFTSVGGSLVQGWQDTLNINPNLNQDNTVDGGGFDFVFDNNNSFTINGPGGSFEVDAFGPAMNAGTQQILVTAGYIDINTPLIGSASPGDVLTLTASGHIEYAPAATGTVSSVGLSMPSAFTVTNSPVISSGTLTVTGAGTSGQYIDGTGALQTFPTIPTPNVYTVNNGLSPQTTPTSNPNNFQLGGPLVQDTTVNGVSTYNMTFDALDGFFVNSIADTFLKSETAYNNWTPANPTAPTYTHHDVDPGYNWMETRDQDLRLGGITYNQLYMKSSLTGTKLFNLIHNSGGINVGMGFGIHSAFSTTTPCVTVSTTGVAQGTATVGQILVLKSMTGTDKGRVEFETPPSGTGTVTSVDLSVPTPVNPAFSVSGNPITTSGTLAISANGTSGQYIDGTGALQTFPTIEVYDGNQGIYKDTSGANDTFMLGAPSGLQSTIPFAVNRYISVAGNRLQMEGNADVLKLIEGTAALAARSSTLEVTAENNFRAAQFTAVSTEAVRIGTYGNVGGLVVENLASNTSYNSNFVNEYGGGLDVKSKTDSRFWIFDASPNSISNVIDIQSVPSAGPYTVGQGSSITFQPGIDLGNNPISNGTVLNSVFSDVTAGAAIVDFRIDTFNLGAPLTHSTFKGTGQLRLNNYTTATSFASASGSSVGVLNVDNAGNVFVGTGGGGGGTYTANNGLTESPANNFQLGGSLLQNTSIVGSDKSMTFTFDGLTTNNGFNITSTSVGAASDSQVLLNVLLDGTNSNPNENTIAVYGANDHVVSGTSSINYGVYGKADGAGSSTPGDTSSSIGVYGVTSTTNGRGVKGFGGTTTVGVEGAGTIGVLGNMSTGGSSAIRASATSPSDATLSIVTSNGTAFKSSNNATVAGNASIVNETALLKMTAAGITTAVGFGTSINFQLQAGNNAVTQAFLSNSVISKWSDAATSTRTSEFVIQGVNSSSTQDQLTIKGSGQLQLNNYTTATSFASASGSSVGVLNVDNTGNVFVGTGGTSAGSILFGTATAAVTDVYTATIGTATTYTDGDAYIVRFTVGNTDAATLNINGIGAKSLYRNNDGALIGGDIWDGGEMLCIYNAVLNGFDCIGTSPNSLFAYVTNDQGSTITKGQAVYAAGGTGNRMTVKLAKADTDATSAQTIGFVFSTSIAANQKGIIIIQGYFTELNLFPPSAGWLDGDTVYLSPTTAGAVTRTKPLAPQHLVYLGVVASTSPGAAGRMYVRVQNGYEMNELHDVASTGAVNNDILYRDTTVTPNLWKPASIPTILGYTPVPTTRSISTTSPLSGGGDLSADRTISIPAATSSVNGYLTSTDWTTFNSKADSDYITLRMQVAGQSPADAQTYYIGEISVSLNTNATLYRTTVPYACTLVGAVISAVNTSAGSTTEASTINFRLNNTTDTLLSNAVAFGPNLTVNIYSITGLNVAIAAGDTFNIKWTTPTWATNPTGATILVTLYLKRT